MPGIGRRARRGRPHLHMFTQDIRDAGFRSESGRWRRAECLAAAANLVERSERVTVERESAGPARAPHTPVLLDSVIRWLSPHDGGVYLDATFGAGGYTRAILGTADTRVIAVDRDPTAIAAGADLVAQSAGRLTLVEDRFSNLAAVAAGQGAARLDGVVMDIGVSSMQLDTAARGFSFRLDGPLDMRMGGDGPSAADVVNGASEADLAKVIFTLGEERFSRPIARAIVAARATAQIATTKALADLVARVVRSKPGDIHPATRTFQALRILVNEELDELLLALEGAESILKPGGRLVVVSFHSLEDRIAKNFLTERGKVSAGSRHQPERRQAPPSFRILTRRPDVADQAEIAANPRARSAKLRAAERTDAPPHAAHRANSPWPDLATIMGRA
jgi:16S rRNA (cytosine1402-N4)-methyltransferase